jgi:hypothetical protein
MLASFATTLDNLYGTSLLAFDGAVMNGSKELVGV